jgi:hypothetical protein
MGTAFWDVGWFFTTGRMLQWYLLPTDVPEASSCTAWQTSREENDHPATWLLSAHLCKERIQNRCKLLPHQQPYTPDQVPLDYHLFRFIKDHMHGHYYVKIEAVQKATQFVCEQLKSRFITKGSSRTVAKVHQSGWGILQRSECNVHISQMWYFCIYN